MPNDFQAWQRQTAEYTETLLQQSLPDASCLPQMLHEAMRYAALDGGKRLRPLLVQAAAELGDCVAAAKEAAMVAIECVHVYSLVHDDMPEMDNDTLRRGKPTCHVKYNAATALLVGDALQTLAFDVLSQENRLPAARQLQMVRTLAKASGSMGMAGGQAIDLAHVGMDMPQAELEQMHSLKTGALIRCAVRLGALSCLNLAANDLQRLDGYAAKLGLAFQVIDDVLDSETDTATLGKTAGKDVQNNKPTYVKLLGAVAARQYAEKLAQEAVDALAAFGQRADRLRELAEFAVFRKK